MKTLRLILWDGLSQKMSSMYDCQKEHDVILLVETLDEFSYVKHHKKKLILLVSAMRHFSDELREQGYSVEHIKIEDKENSQSFWKEIEKAVKKHQIQRIVVTHPSEYRVWQALLAWAKDIELEIREDNRFLGTKQEFLTWAEDREHLRMEFFYREMRKKHHILMDGSAPVGGKWNFDSENRRFPKEPLSVPATYTVKPDQITQTVIQVVGEYFSDHFGELDNFGFAVTRKDALEVLNQFIQERLIHFGDYQDAMLQGEPWMYHSHLSFYLNCGLLFPLECIEAAEEAYYQHKAPLNATEGFIRQILGWREYVYGIYWLKMPHYEHENFFNAKNKLPGFYWSADTKMNCLKQCVSQTKALAYAHHIQRLMVLGNFALLTGMDPKEVNEWYWIVYADAYQWVELPNVSGMILFADGGYLASKPYAAGGAYINKMSNYCQNCQYKVSVKNGDSACPFNYLYWNFLATHRDKLKTNQRLSMIYQTYDKMDNAKKVTIRKDSEKFIESL